jgi:hypothetical protein
MTFKEVMTMAHNVIDCSYTAYKKMFFRDDVSIIYNRDSQVIIVTHEHPEHGQQVIRVPKKIADTWSANTSYYKDIIVGYVMGYNTGLIDSMEG